MVFRVKMGMAVLLVLFLTLILGEFVKSVYVQPNRDVRDVTFISKGLYDQQRDTFLDDERKLRIGSHIVFNEKEEVANQILMSWKRKEINESRVPFGRQFLPNIHFFKSKSLMENSEIFKIIRKMPKGAALHLHETAVVDINWLVKNVTYMPNCYMCNYNDTGDLKFHFFQNSPPNTECQWKLVAKERQASQNQSQFDQMLYNSMSIIVDDPKKAYPTIDHVWRQFEKAYSAAESLVIYEPVWEMYIYEALNEFNEDNVQYIEIRGGLHSTYDFQGYRNNKTWAMQTYANIIDRYVRDHPEFTGGKIIYAGIRDFNSALVLKEVKEAMEFITQFPDHFAGYDLVGQEDPGKPLTDYVDALLYPSQHDFHLPFFFHAAETDWEGTSTDNNLIDAVLLNTSRIGHGYALPKHPQVMKMVKQHDIAVEVNPISNQVLMLVDDLRNHPAAVLISEGFPVVISSDDPSVWGARGLSYDFYMAFMGLMGEDADLKVLKQLAINSLEYSALSPDRRQAAIQSWEYKWNRFIDEVVGSYQPTDIGK